MQTTNLILSEISVCETVVLCSFNGDYPDARDLTNALNKGTKAWPLYFMTGRNTPKYAQIAKNPHCCLYYFNPDNRHSVRLYGEIMFDTDIESRKKYWRPEYEKFGYLGPNDPDFVLMRFEPKSYKFYVGADIKTGNL